MPEEPVRVDTRQLVPGHRQKFRFYLFYYYYTLSSGFHMHNMQACYIGIHVPWWLAASITPSSVLGISPNTIPPQSPHLLLSFPPPAPNRPLCVMFPSLCLCVLIVQHPLMSENMWYLVFCSYVSLLRMMVSSFIHVPAKDISSFFFMAA